MRILVACEESQAVTKEFRALGHEAWSCDILESSGGHPEWHIQGDVLPLLEQKWDMLIAFPPCTYLSNAGATHLFPKGVLNEERYAKGLLGKQFFMALLNANIPKIAVENPTPSKIYELPLPTQVIQPWQFGHPTTKRTLLWLKGLPKLEATEIVTPTTTTQTPGSWFQTGGKNRAILRSKTFQGIAAAMANQWGQNV